MNIVKSIQDRWTRSLYKHLLTIRGDRPNVKHIETLTAEILSNQSKLPLSGNYRPEGYEQLNRNRFNSEIGLVQVDANTIFDSIIHMYDRIGELGYILDIWKEYTDNRLNLLSRSARKYAISDDFYSTTTDVDILNITDYDISTATISNDGIIQLTKSTKIESNIIPIPTDISIEKIGNQGTANILGDKSKVFNINSRDKLFMFIHGRNEKEAGFEITAKIDPTKLNSIVIKLGADYAGLKIVASINKNDTVYTEVYNEVVSKSSIHIYFDECVVTRIRIRLTRSIPNIISSADIKYEFVIHSILLCSTTTESDAVYQTKPIELSDSTSHVKLLIDSHIEDGSDINVMVSTSVDRFGAPTGFIKADNMVSFSKYETVPTEIILEPKLTNKEWVIPQIAEYGLKLYNILENVTNVTGQNFKIENGVITGTDNWKISPESIKLYRGYGDYIKSSSIIEYKTSVDPVVYHPTYDMGSRWFSPIYLYVKVKSIIDPNSIILNKIIINNKLQHGDILLECEDGSYIPNAVVSIKHIGSTTEVTLSNTAVTDIDESYYAYYIVANIEMKDYIQTSNTIIRIVPESIRIHLDGFVPSEEDEGAVAFLELGNDYELDNSNYNIIIKKTANTISLSEHITMGLSSNSKLKDVPISIEFEYYESRIGGTVYFETFAFSPNPVDVTIVPFNSLEISKGNFHNINGIDVSLSRRARLRSGWNTIQSTQPHGLLETVHNYDVNMYTGLWSAAAIIIPDNIQVQAYKDTMRHVSPFMLMSMENKESKKCFAYDDGKLLISFRPNSICEDLFIFDEYVHLIGEHIICKKPIYNTLENEQYEIMPEKFKLTFSLNRGDQLSKKTLAVRIEMATDAINSDVSVNRIEYKEYTGE